MSVIGNAITLGAGSSGAVKVMTQGQVSTTSAYTGTNFDNSISDYDFVEVHLFRGGADIAYNVVKVPASSTTFNITGDRTYSMSLTPTRISCTNYSGSFVNLYVDVYAYHKAG